MEENEKRQTITALLEELRGYRKYGLTDKAEQVEVCLRRLGAQAAPAAKKASTRKKKA